MDRPSFITFGDSITEHAFEDGGWAVHLMEKYLGRVDIVNRGLSGYNTRWLRMILPQVFPFEQEKAIGSIRLITICVGANDAVWKEYGEKQHVPVDEYKSNLLSIVQDLKAKLCNRDHSGAVIVLISPPPVDSKVWEARCREKYANEPGVIVPNGGNRSNDLVRPYVTAMEDVAKITASPFINVFKLMQEQKDVPWTSFLSDGLHLSREGNLFFATKLMETIASSFPNLIPDAIPYTFPHHTVVDYKNPGNTFRTPCDWIK